MAPALAVMPGFEQGDLVFVLYREPKLAVLSILGWLFLSAGAWQLRQSTFTIRTWRPGIWSARSWWGPGLPLVLFVAVVGWLSLSGLWALVPANALYELRQWVLVLLVTILVVAWARLEPRAQVGRRLSVAMIAAGALVTAIGAVQLVVDVPLLVAIDADRYGVRHASTFGYKNPAALAVLGQLFVLLGTVATSTNRRSRLALGALAVLEILYVSSLQSRTAWLALAVGLCLFGGLVGLAQPCLRRWRMAATLVLSLVSALALLAAGLLASEQGRERASSVVDHLRPEVFLKSDRGLYLRNTLVMAEKYPLGVGVGDWQTYYPVFRTHGRDFGFDGLHQVRRAHSDHVQMLGEGGWPGLTLWSLLIASVAVVGASATRRRRSMAAAAATAQWLTLNVAMATDYVVEMPYHRLLWGLSMALVLIEARRGRLGSLDGAQADQDPSGQASSGLASRVSPATVAVLIMLMVVAVGEVLHAGALMRGVLASTSLQHAYLQAMAVSPADRGPDLERVLVSGQRMNSTPFHTKTRYRSELMIAHAEALMGRESLALAAAQRALSLYPFDPVAMRLIARLIEARQPEQAAAWQRAAAHVEREAVAGFEGTYPPWPESPSADL